MAFKIGALKVGLPGGGEAAAPSQADQAPGASVMARPLPLIGRLRIGRQLQVLTTLLVVLLLVDAAVVVIDTQKATHSTIYIATVGKIRMLSQRLAKAAQQASQGN